MVVRINLNSNAHVNSLIREQWERDTFPYEYTHVHISVFFRVFSLPHGCNSNDIFPLKSFILYNSKLFCIYQERTITQLDAMMRVDWSTMYLMIT
jgi:hypothetical protein